MSWSVISFQTWEQQLGRDPSIIGSSFTINGQPVTIVGVAPHDYRRTFATLKGLPCDVFLGAHGAYFDMLGKLARIKAGAQDNVWIDPKGYQAAVAEREQAFEKELARQEN